MSTDARVMAWMNAKAAMDAACEIRNAVERATLEGQELTHPELVSRQYDQLLREADIHARLATADVTVGMLAGEWLDRDEERKRERERMMQTFKDKVMSKERVMSKEEVRESCFGVEEDSPE